MLFCFLPDFRTCCGVECYLKLFSIGTARKCADFPESTHGSGFVRLALIEEQFFFW